MPKGIGYEKKMKSGRKTTPRPKKSATGTKKTSRKKSY